MSQSIQVGDRVEWLHTFASGVERTRTGKVVTLNGDMAYVRTRRASQPVKVELRELVKVEPEQVVQP